MITEAVKTTWAIDPMHSEIQFKVRHMMISTVTGRFTTFEGGLETENEDFDGAAIHFVAQIDSITTNNQQRDAHLKSNDFFNVETYPQLTFQNGTLAKTTDGKYTLTGDLTIREVTKQVTLDVEHFGIMVDPYGNTKAGFEINGQIDRKEFNLRWSAVTEAGGIVVSDEVKLNLNVQLAKQ